MAKAAHHASGSGLTVHRWTGEETSTHATTSTAPPPPSPLHHAPHPRITHPPHLADVAGHLHHRHMLLPHHLSQLVHRGQPPPRRLLAEVQVELLVLLPLPAAVALQRRRRRRRLVALLRVPLLLLLLARVRGDGMLRQDAEGRMGCRDAAADSEAETVAA